MSHVVKWLALRILELTMHVINTIPVCEVYIFRSGRQQAPVRRHRIFLRIHNRIVLGMREPDRRPGEPSYLLVRVNQIGVRASRPISSSVIDASYRASQIGNAAAKKSG